ncbi:hypothetical protein ACN47A_24610 [Myxococcus fulvus]|uniref:hypothetical protein n=1 Tax=Myxococcus fulvus TaxID=33 RepID=UPI003B9D8C28
MAGRWRPFSRGMTKPSSAVESQSPTPEPLAGESVLSLSFHGGQHLSVVCAKAEAPAMLRELVAAVPALASVSGAGAEETNPGMNFTLNVSRPAPELSPVGTEQPPLSSDATPHLKVGDAHIDLTLDASDVTGKLDQLDERLGKTLALADRVAGIVTLGDLAAVITAVSGALGVLTGPHSWADTETRQRITQATMALVTRAEQLARGT